MRRTFSILIAGLAILVAASACRDAQTAEAQTGQKTLTGKVVDLTCYAMDRANTGPDHHEASDRTSFACAWACVRWEGQPAGLLTADGKIYQVAGGLAAGSNVKIASHLGHTVTISGEVSEKDGLLMIASNDLKMATE